MKRRDMKYKWEKIEMEKTPIGFIGGNYILRTQPNSSWYISYNPHASSELGLIDNILNPLKGSQETALYISLIDEIIVLEGDFRKTIEESGYSTLRGFAKLFSQLVKDYGKENANTEHAIEYLYRLANKG